jgi:S1-C subfamily serine protease
LPAAQAELKPGDIITAINEKALSPQLPLLYHIYTYLPGSTVSFTVLRSGETITVPVVLGEN